VKTAVPVFHRAYDCNVSEVTQVVATMTALTTMVAPRDFLLIGDSKLVSYSNLVAMTEAGVAFLAPASKTYVPADVLAALEIHVAVEVDHVAEWDLGKPALQRGRCHVIEDTMTLAGPRKKDPVLTLRRVFVHSTARAQAALTVRERKLAQARDDLERLERGLGSLGTDPATGKPHPGLVVRRTGPDRRGGHRRLARAAWRPCSSRATGGSPR
jgi:hypothetical protein